MEKLIRYVLVPITVFAILLFFLYRLSSESWVYDLPNHYKIRKESTARVVLGQEIDGDFYTEYHHKKIGIEDYIAEFQYNSQFVGCKVLTIDDGNTSILFYLIDTKEQYIHGPYSDEESYLAASGVWTDEAFGEWITTTETPEGAHFQ